MGVTVVAGEAGEEGEACLDSAASEPGRLGAGLEFKIVAADLMPDVGSQIAVQQGQDVRIALE